MQYKYVATTREGKVETGLLTAEDTKAAGEQIRAAGLLLVSLKKKRESILESLVGIGSISPLEKVTFSKHLSLMIRAGLPIDESIGVLTEQVKGPFKKILDAVYETVQSGRPLSEAFAEHPKVFSDFFISAIRAGEQSGTLGESLQDLAEQMTKSFELTRKIRGAMTYPIIVVVAAVTLGMTLALFVLPKIINLFESITVDLPLSTRMLLASSSFMVEHGAIAVPGIIGLSILFWRFLKLKKVRPYSHYVYLHLPFFGKFTKEYNIAIFARTMGTLLRAGINIGEAIQITSNTVRNERFRLALANVREEVEKGVSMASLLADHPKVFPPLVSHMISVGEKTGRLEETYDYITQFYEDDVDGMAKNLATLMEPVLLIIIGIFVAGITISIIAPIYNFIGNIDRL